MANKTAAEKAADKAAAAAAAAAGADGPKPPATDQAPAAGAAPTDAGTGGDGSDTGAGDGSGDDDAEDERIAKEAAAFDKARAAQAPTVKNRVLVREQNGNTTIRAISLLMEACDRFGIDPSADKRPVELLAWRYYQGDDDPARLSPDAVVVVTAGGAKLRHYDDPDLPLDPDTQGVLERVFGCTGIDPKTKLTVTKPLPDDLTLPAVAVTGVGTTEHQYVGGYLKAGGRKAAADKAARAAERARRAGLA